MSQFTITNMGKNICFYFFILITSSLGFMHPRVAFFESRDLAQDTKFKSHREKDADFSVKLVKTLTNFIERKISEIPGVNYIRAIFSIPPEIMSQFTNKNMGKNIFFYFFILVTSSLGFMHPRVVFLKSRYLTKDVTFKIHTEKDTDFSVKLVKALKNFIERKISEIPRELKRSNQHNDYKRPNSFKILEHLRKMNEIINKRN